MIGRWDRERLDQLITSLLANAVRYGAGKPIAVRIDGDDAVAKVAVRDRGVGIAPEDLERIFGRFERAASLLHYGGLGLGLYIARQIAEAHGGLVRGRDHFLSVDEPVVKTTGLRPSWKRVP
jgi:signal transduction histidine kinase